MLRFHKMTRQILISFHLCVLQLYVSIQHKNPLNEIFVSVFVCILHIRFVLKVLQCHEWWKRSLLHVHTRFKIDAAMPVSNNLRGQEILCSFAYCLSYFYCIIDTDLRHCLNKLILCDLYIAIFFAVSHVLHIMAQCWHNLSKIIALIH